MSTELLPYPSSVAGACCAPLVGQPLTATEATDLLKCLQEVVG